MSDERPTAADAESGPAPSVFCGWWLAQLFVPTISGRALRVLAHGAQSSHTTHRLDRVTAHDQGEQC